MFLITESGQILVPEINILLVIKTNISPKAQIVPHGHSFDQFHQWTIVFGALLIFLVLEIEFGSSRLHVHTRQVLSWGFIREVIW